MNPRLDSLEAIEAAIWRELESAVGKTDHAWRTGTLATVGEGYADARTVVLRELDVARRELLIYTDARSAKVA
ncbi:MAG TPA: pyridoxamine 5'-phosphate oxidase, partial [Albitalea sp.]|nr:pyridoxamine 5'-phosphate oxidase [Albitalea sp.]